jgi:hypothetical protein
MKSQKRMSQVLVHLVIHTALADTRTNFKKHKGRASHLRGPFSFS